MIFSFESCEFGNQTPQQYQTGRFKATQNYSHFEGADTRSSETAGTPVRI